MYINKNFDLNKLKNEYQEISKFQAENKIDLHKIENKNEKKQVLNKNEKKLVSFDEKFNEKLNSFLAKIKFLLGIKIIASLNSFKLA